MIEQAPMPLVAGQTRVDPKTGDEFRIGSTYTVRDVARVFVSEDVDVPDRVDTSDLIDGAEIKRRFPEVRGRCRPNGQPETRAPLR